MFEGLFVKSPIMLEHGIPIFFRLFSDVERTGQDNEFYEKFQFRHYLCEILHFYLKKARAPIFPQKFQK